jgi:hypothetical protein
MSGDYSRQRFDPFKDFSGVLMQQGRVQLDADWNELVDIVIRRVQAGTADTIGTATVPRSTSGAFAIDLSTGTALIGPGRMYVDGLLAENHGTPHESPPGEFHFDFDRVLAEPVGRDPVAYDDQPYFPNVAAEAPFPGAGGPHLAYLDVWQREVTYLEDESLLEVAVGVDTTTRLQTAWQVRVLEDVGAGATCDTADAGLLGWTERTAPSAGRLTSRAVGVAADDDPCLTPPQGGFKGLDNRTFRVEIHDGGAQGVATFKWSDSGGSIATSVTEIPDATRLVVARIGRDRVLRFKPGDWVEINDDWLELAGKPGIMARIKSVDDATRTIILTAAIPAGTFAAVSADLTKRHTRVRRWSQSGVVVDANNQILVDLTAAGSAGVIPVPPDGTSVDLIDGARITFSTHPTGGSYRVGDYWTFAARTANSSVEELTEAPPRGVHHHYARLAIVTRPSDVQDCRTLWPPEVGHGGCECTICLSPDGGARAIQEAIEQVKREGATICLGPGFYNLGEQAIRISGARALRIKGHGLMTQLAYLGSGPAITVENSIDVTLEQMAVLTSGRGLTGGMAIDARNCAGLTLERCVLVQLGSSESPQPALGLSGIVAGTFVRENVIVGASGIGNGQSRAEGISLAAIGPTSQGLLTVGLFVDQNFIVARDSGIRLERTSIHLAQTRLADNLVAGCGQVGVAVLGSTLLTSGVVVRNNSLQVRGVGIVCSTDDAQIEANFVSGLARVSSATILGGIASAGSDGIILGAATGDGLDRCQVIGNRVVGVGGDAISIRTAVRSALIKQNSIEGTGGGIVMGPDARADVIDIDDNQLLGIAPRANDEDLDVVGIRVIRASEVAITNNAISGLGERSVLAKRRTGIDVVGPSRTARISGNSVVDIGPPGEFVREAAGIQQTGPIDYLAITDNQVTRATTPSAAGARSVWRAINVAVPTSDGHLKASGIADFLTIKGFVYSLYLKVILRLPVGSGQLAMRGNHLRSYGVAETVLAITPGSCLLSDNACAQGAGAQSPGVAVTAGAIIANANYVDTRTDIAMDFVLGQAHPMTVLGNITRGGIRVDGNALGGAWQGLNVTAI